MAPRHRSVTYTRPRGTWTRFGTTAGGGSIASGLASCHDHVNDDVDCAPFSVENVILDGGIINTPNGGFFAPYFQNYVADVLTNWDNFGVHSPLPGDAADVVFATRAVARTNPSRPYVDVGVNVAELADVVSLIRRSGSNLIAAVGSNNLRYQFGIRPLVSDLVKINRFHNALDMRIRELMRLRNSKHGLRRTVKLGYYEQAWQHNKVCQSQGGVFINKTFNAHTGMLVKGHCRWMPAVDLTKLSDREMSVLIHRSLYGLTVDASTLWEALPWSWMIDWASSVGDYFKANRNIVPATLMGVHIMRHTKTVHECDAHISGTTTMEGIRVVKETKTRNPSFVAPAAHFPFLSGNQMGILASLAVTRRG